MYDVVITELLKLKRSKVVLLIPISSLIPIFFELSIQFGQNSILPFWGSFLHTILVLTNFFSLGGLSLITGYIFTREYQENTINTLFTYPISRLKFYMGKLFVVLLITLTIFSLTTGIALITGAISNYKMFSSDILIIFLKGMFWSALINFSILTLVAFLGTISKNLISTAFLGIVLIISDILLNIPKLNVFMPGCIPALIASQKKVEMGGYLYFDGDLNKAYITLLITFAVSIFAGIFYNQKMDIS